MTTLSNPKTWPLLRKLNKEQRILSVIAIASAFFILELAIGFRNRSLALIADAFHISSDLIGYLVAYVAVRMGKRDRVTPGKYSFGYQKASLVGGFFNGAFLMALGVSILLQSIERFLEPSEIIDPVLIMAIGAAGVGSNILMILIMGGHDSDKELTSSATETEGTTTADHSTHAHSRAETKGHGADLNILGIFIHILGDALNSIAVIISAGVYHRTGFRYADPIAAVFVGVMVVGTSYPLVVRSGRYLLESAPEGIDIDGVKEDVERITGKGTVHELHIWNLSQSKVMMTMHIATDDVSISSFSELSANVRQCLHLWDIHIAVIEPETRASLAPAAAVDLPFLVGWTPMMDLSHRAACKLRCETECDRETCCM